MLHVSVRLLRDLYDVSEDIGHGCGIMEVDNDAVVGTMCNPTTYADLGCENPDEPLPPVERKPVEKDDSQCGDPCSSPIIIDLGNESYRLTSLADGVPFDLQNEGQRRQIAWTRAGVENAFLALDRNGNGQIDNGSELFGNFTPLTSGALASNGFIALAEFDRNGDAVIDGRDPIWSYLLLWVDRNHDGWSTGDELAPLAASAILSLDTDYTPVGRKDQWGNHFRFQAKFRLSHHVQEQTRTYYDVFFRSEP